MTSDMQHAKRPVSAMLAGPYGHPFHPILVTVPIGAWVASLVFDIASHVAGDPQALARGSAWLLAVGVLGALVAAVIGLLDLLAIPTGTTAFRTGLVHMSLNLIVTVTFALDFWWRQSGRGPDGAVPIGQLVLSIIALAVLGVSGFLGGKLAYHYGVRVADETTQAAGYRHSVPSTGVDSLE
ncbi:DUF2231 domain-containing protein [Nocardia sp. NPDC050412]|uniref:DUF2231 domain-containing protein n=1 Tax=Nocardia sp. NPDC050412 TaxID=3364320 RepID=UPI0037A09EBF